MKKIYNFLLIAVMMGMSYGIIQAQNPQFHNGTSGTSSNSFPLNTTTSNHVQWIYGPNFFGSGGTGVGTPAYNGNIVKVYFRIGGSSNPSATYTDFTISLAQNVGTLSSWTNGTYNTSLTQVFYQSSFTSTGAASGQWFGVVLQTPFQYDPSLALIFDLKVSGGTGNSVYQVSTTGINARIWGNYTATTGSFGTGRVDFGFDLVPASTQPNDAGVASIDSPAGGCEGVQNVVATVKNYGINQVDTVTVNWMFNSVLQTPVDYYQLLDTFNGAGSTSGQVYLGQVTLTGGQSDTIIAWTTMPNNKQDSVNDNDTTMAVYNSLSTITSYPYIEDFDSTQGEWFIGGTNSSWAWGSPAKTVITGASSGLNAFVTGGLGTGQYNGNENSYVGSPCFDFSGFQGTPWVAFDVWWNSEFSWDGAVLQTSVDGGTSWQTVGAYQDPNNWYTDNTINGNPGGSSEGWSGRVSSSNGSGGWKTAKHALDPSLVGQQLRFRVAFGSDGSVNDDGFAFDHFRLVDFQEADLGPDIISLCGKSGVTLDPNIPVNGNIAWSTGDSSSASIVVSNQGLYWVVYTDTLIDETTSDSVIIVQTAPPVINFARLIDTISIDGNTTLDPNLPFNINYTWTPGGYNYPYLLLRGADLGLGSHVYNLEVVDSVLCSDQESVTVVVVDFTGIEDREAELLSMYPNPVHSVLTLDVRNLNEDKIDVAILDIQGKQHYRNTYNVTGGKKIDIDMSALPAGNYILKIITRDNTINKQISKY
jgi:hypothetical protein